MEKLFLQNKEYCLVPKEDWDEVQLLLKDYFSRIRKNVVPTPEIVVQKQPLEAFSDEDEENIPSGIELDGVDVKKAQPTMSNYRERFKRQELSKSDVTAPINKTNLQQFGEDEFSRFRDPNSGDSLFFGKGLENDYY